LYKDNIGFANMISDAFIWHFNSDLLNDNIVFVNKISCMTLLVLLK